MTFIVLLNAVLVESEGELGVCFPPRQTTRNKKGVYIIINNNDFYRVLLNAVFESSWRCVFLQDKPLETRKVFT